MDAICKDAICEVPLTRGLFATIDAADWPLVSQFKWHAVESRNSNGYYAGACLSRALQAIHGFRTVSLHQFILGRPGKLIDHRDGNGLNNRRNNLRIATTAGNAQNCRKQVRPTSSRFKGVSWSKKYGRWVVFVCSNNRNKFFGNFDDEVEAGKAYDEAALRLFGEFARLNFPAEVSA
jgi:hypothetical protein